MLQLLQQLRAQRENGFTLIELMVVVLIIGILAAIAIPVFNSLRVEGAKAAVKSDVKSTVTAAQTAATTEGGGTVSSDTEGVISVAGEPTQEKVVESEGVSIAITPDTTDAQHYVITGTTEADPSFNYTFHSRTGQFTNEQVAPAAPGAGTVTQPDAGPVTPPTGGINLPATTAFQASYADVNAAVDLLNSHLASVPGEVEYVGERPDGRIFAQTTDGRQHVTATALPESIDLSMDDFYGPINILPLVDGETPYAWSSEAGYYGKDANGKLFMTKTRP